MSGLFTEREDSISFLENEFIFKIICVITLSVDMYLYVHVRVGKCARVCVCMYCDYV